VDPANYHSSLRQPPTIAGHTTTHRPYRANSRTALELSFWTTVDSSMYVRVTLQLTVSQYVLVSSLLCGHFTRYCFLFDSLGLEFVVLSLWGALSGGGEGGYFMTDSQSGSQSVLVLSTLVGLAARYYFLSECCCLKFVV
jgi:hypothetical protein